MARLGKKGIIAATAAGIAVAAGGAAIAATSGGTGPDADLASALQKQGVQVTADQIKQAQLDVLKARLDADVAAGRLTRSQADQILQRAQQGLPPRCGPGGGRMGMRGPHEVAVQAVAKLMDVTPAQLRAQLKDGTTLAQAAAKKGVSRDDVVAAIQKALDGRQLPPGVTARQMAGHIADEAMVLHAGGRYGGPGGGPFGPPPASSGSGSGSSSGSGTGTTTTPQYGN